VFATAPSGMYTTAKFVMDWNTLVLNVGRVIEWKRIEVILEELRKAFSPIVVTLIGIVSVVKLVHLENALAPIERTLDGITTDAKLAHSKNA
jgi:hypothetical protein